ncbi:hypothetical protein P8A22_35275 [Streptomyces laculatispora]|uniref:Uncharacterized protein n=1 Tax=Streptomyces laculatispora TaxID=887464 RepID=A0ABY9ICY9_9ACTN|nr:hypothetical protein [Streptomyces laculatispora]WLQ44700.1 hypothetical protein P8A22_35275 [Streptomyces laculatispora]
MRTARLANHLVGVTIQYTGAEEWYTLTGSPTSIPNKGLEDFHAAVLAAIAHGA